MRALVYDPSLPQKLAFAELPDPVLALLERRQLQPNIGFRDSWDRVQTAASALLGRQVAGKVALDVRGNEGR